MPAIYALFDPRDPDLVTYVGFASIPARRLRDHKGAWRKPTRLGKWVAKLRKDGVTPAQRVLQEVPWEEKDAAEVWWIAHYRAANPSLLNVTNGGSREAWWAAGDRRKIGPRLSNGKFSTNRGKRENETALRAQRRAAGVCDLCGRKRHPKFKRCRAHVAYFSAYIRRKP